MRLLSISVYLPIQIGAEDEFIDPSALYKIALTEP
jgi:hypothetical protein